MKTYIINGQKVFDYSSNPEPPAWHAKLAQLDPAVGESKTVVTSVLTRAEEIEAAHKAKYNWDSLNAAIVELTRAKALVHDIADQLLWEHEEPFYRYAACGGGGHDYTHYADGGEWAQRREVLTKLKWDNVRDKPVEPKSQQQPRGFWARLFRRNEPAQD